MDNIILIRIPNYCNCEIKYIISIFYDTFLGVNYVIENHDQDFIEIKHKGKSINISAKFFKLVNEHGWLSAHTLCTPPLLYWNNNFRDLGDNLTSENLPVFFGEPNVKFNGKNLDCDVDIFGSSFYILSRYEEAVIADRDKLGRFKLSSSVLSCDDLLSRPVVNEYLETLWSFMKLLWPDMVRINREFRMNVTADLDIPYHCGSKNLLSWVKQLAGDVLRRKNLSLLPSTFLNYFASKNNNYRFDKHYQNIYWMMGVNELLGNVITFNFIAGGTHKLYDACYNIQEPAIRIIMKDIHARGHVIGLHPSFETYNDYDKINSEYILLKKIMIEEKIAQHLIGARQHYLRWDVMTTPALYEKVNLKYDSSLCFAEKIGFRSGTCYEYPMYDLAARKRLNLIQRPLIVMEHSVFSKKYMGLNYDEKTLEILMKVKNTCKKFKGDFTLLWHNNHFIASNSKNIYCQLIKIK